LRERDQRQERRDPTEKIVNRHDRVYLATLRAIDAAADAPLVPQLIGAHNVMRPAAGFERGSLAI
jgi:hypothetical protein